MKSKRLFVVGMARSGHTWFTNLLGNNPELIRPIADEDGSSEANMLDFLPAKYGAIKKPMDYIGLIELWSQTELFKATGVDKEIFYRIKPRPTSYYKLFKILMDNFSELNGGRTWIQKCSPRTVLKILEEIPDAEYVLITRSLMGNLKSKLKAEYDRGNHPPLAREVYIYVMHEKIMNRTGRMLGRKPIRYEDLKADTAGVIKSVCAELGLTFSEDMLVVPFEPNTSFSNDADRRKVLSLRAKLMIRLYYLLFKLLPLSFMQWVYKLVYNQLKYERAVLHTYSFLSIQEKYGID